MTHVIRLGHHAYPVEDIFNRLPPGAWFLMTLEVGDKHLIAHTNVGDYIIGDVGALGAIKPRETAERIGEP